MIDFLLADEYESIIDGESSGLWVISRLAGCVTDRCPWQTWSVPAWSARRACVDDQYDRQRRRHRLSQQMPGETRAVWHGLYGQRNGEWTLDSLMPVTDLLKTLTFNCRILPFTTQFGTVVSVTETTQTTKQN